MGRGDGRGRGRRRLEAVLGMLAATVGIGAAHAVGGRAWARVAMVAAVALVTLAAVVGIASVGTLLLPAALFGWAAVAVGARTGA